MNDAPHYPGHFDRSEFLCSHCGAEGMRQQTLDRLGRLRLAYGAPIVITSGYRCPQHPKEAAKASGPGAHAIGAAVDVRAIGREAYRLVKLALELGFTGVGISQRDGQPRYVHLDDAEPETGLVRPTMWSY